MNLAVVASNAQQQHRAEVLAQCLNLPVSDTPDAYEAVLLCSAKGLALQLCGAGAPGPVSVDFAAGAMRHRRKGGQNELLGKAIGVGKLPRLAVLDATAGLGRDSFVLADLGCQVQAWERQPVIAALLQDGLLRAAAADEPWLRQTAERISLHPGDVLPFLQREAANSIDVVYLDPMFPQRHKSALVKKEMLLFQRLLHDADCGEALLPPALHVARYRVVVKRPLKAAPLGNSKPSHSIKGKTIRFDVYPLKKMVAV